MARQLKEVVQEILTKLQSEIEKVVPNIVLGDEDSMFLTDHQEGFSAGLHKAISIIEHTEM